MDSPIQVLRILIVDDQERVRLGVRLLLQTQQNWVVCGEAATGRQGVDQARQLRPDIILMDVTMPDLDGLAATREITSEDPQSHIIILTQYDSDTIRSAALSAGACGYVLKSRPQDLLPAIQAIQP
jgi:DNA-binding NarL/FixJ family response regulator